MKKSTILQLALLAFIIVSIIFSVTAFFKGTVWAMNPENSAINTSTTEASATTNPEESSEFTGIILQGAWNVTITKSDIHTINPQFLGDQNPDDILIEIDSNKTLLLTNPDRNNPVAIELTAPLLTFIDSRGKSDINISSINGDYLYISGMENSSFNLKNCSFGLITFDITNSLVNIDSEAGEFQGEIKDKSILRYKGNHDISTLSVSEDSIVEEFNF